MFKFKNQVKPPLAGLKQAIAVAIYCGLIGALLNFLGNTKMSQGQFLSISLMLVLLVVSAAITGFLIFGYPAYLMLEKKMKEALAVLGYTFMYLLVIFLVVLLFISL